ncbi:MAG TPA: CHAP domain-containing protein [Kofleriaceae bacterium]|nr:CHAP domain-containing protein [Kofleriaceae bacterium]
MSGPYRKWRELDEHSGPLEACFAPDDGPAPGDILLVGDAASSYGRHIALVEDYDVTRGIFTTIEGNGTGALPTGRPARGVVRARRSVGRPLGTSPTPYHARRLLRPSSAALE